MDPLWSQLAGVKTPAWPQWLALLLAWKVLQFYLLTLS